MEQVGLLGDFSKQGAAFLTEGLKTTDDIVGNIHAQKHKECVVL